MVVVMLTVKKFILKKLINFQKIHLGILDGHDLYGNANKKTIFNGEEIIGNQFPYSFKREMVFKEKKCFPTGFGIPENVIRPIVLEKKKSANSKKTYPKYANFEKLTDLAVKKIITYLMMKINIMMTSKILGLDCHVKGG